MPFMKKRSTYRKRKTYKKKPLKRTKQVQRNTKRINTLVKSTLVKTYWQHNDNDRVDISFPSIAEPEYRSFTPLVPNTFQLLFNKMTSYQDQQKVYIHNCKVALTLTLANATQARQPIDYSIFCVKVKPRMRAQFYGQTSGLPTHTINLLRDVHFTGNLPAGQARVPGGSSNNLANIRLNPDIFQIHYYRHGYFSMTVKNQTSPGSALNTTTDLQLKRFTFNIPYKCELKSDTWLETDPGGPSSNRYWTQMNQDDIPLFNRYHIFIFTSANHELIPDVNPGQNLLQSNIQCLFNATSAN